MRRRAWIFAGIVGACVIVGGSSVAFAIARSHRSAAPASAGVVTETKRFEIRGGQILFRNVIADRTFGDVALAPLANPGSARVISRLKCDRVYFAAGAGLCLTARGVWPAVTYWARLFDRRLHVRHEIRLSGIPSRARVSADGKLGATTVFVNGDSYAAGNFSTRTLIIDMRSGKVLANLEQFDVTRDGKRFYNRNFNFWGVTFAKDGDRFYATLGSGGSTYLVQGSLRARTLRVIHDHVECPSLSPDGTRVAFKRSLDSHGNWRLYVLDLRTMRETELSERQPMDDQAEWVDNEHVSYWRANTVWVVQADGRGAPRALVTNAFSPAIVRAA